MIGMEITLGMNCEEERAEVRKRCAFCKKPIDGDGKLPDAIDVYALGVAVCEGCKPKYAVHSIRWIRNEGSFDPPFFPKITFAVVPTPADRSRAQVADLMDRMG